MKIFTTSDMHGNLSDLNPEGCDIVIIAGDFADLKGGGKWHWYDQKKWIQKKFIPWTQKYTDTEFVVVPGNHDMVCDIGKCSVYPDLNFNIEYPSNVHMLINSGITLKGLNIYGSPNIPIISYRWAFETQSDTLKHVFSNIPYNLDILVTHSPPHIPNECVDKSMQWGGAESFGSNELTEEILEKKPKMVFCGHIHSGTHGGVKFNDTMIYNVSRVDERYEIAYEPTVLEI